MRKLTVGRGALLVLATIALGCGGTNLLNELENFQPRSANIGDLNGQTYEFTFFANGNPIDGGLGAMALQFGSFEGTESTFSIVEVDGGSASGSVRFEDDRLFFTVVSTAGSIALAPSDARTVIVEGDTTSNRIRLSSEDRSVVATSNGD